MAEDIYWLASSFCSINSTSISSTSDPDFGFHPYYRSIEHSHRAVIMAVATQDLNIPKRALQTPRRGHIAADKTITVPNSFDTILSASTVSTVSSLAGFHNIWDLPKTPTKQTSSASLQDILAPRVANNQSCLTRLIDLIEILQLNQANLPSTKTASNSSSRAKID
jgi:hypothetical protein